jgi:nicotinamidase-related amidase
MLPVGPNQRTRWLISPDRVDLTRSRTAGRPVEFASPGRTVVADLARTALVVVDMQNDFCHPDGWLASIGVDVTPARAPIEPLRVLLPALRAAGVPIVWLNWGNRPDLANLPPGVLAVYNPDGAGLGLGEPVRPGGSRTLQAGSWSAAVVDELVVEPDDLRVDKYRMSGFHDTPLDAVLRNLDVTTLLFAGVNADQCVFATLIDAACIGYDVVFLRDCCATTSPGYCWDATVYNVAQCFGLVADSGPLLDALHAGATAKTAPDADAPADATADGPAEDGSADAPAGVPAEVAAATVGR